MKLEKYKNNPILKPGTNKWEDLCVLNPAVIYDEENQEFKMLYRAAGNDKEHYINIGLATSKDGFNFTRQFNHPVLAPRIDGEDGGCCEDPRLFKLNGYYYVTYASRTFAPGQYWKKDKGYFGFKPVDGPSFLINNNSITYLAISKDLVTFKRLGRITDSRIDDRDVVLFPQKVNGKYVKFSRPMNAWGDDRYNGEAPSIYITYSDDMMEWGKPSLFLKGKEWWEDKKIGISTPPIMSKYGWFVTYHGVSTKDQSYRVGAMILDKDNPSKILAKTKDFIMEPEYPYETDGFYNGCVFPTGIAIKDDIMYLYYGCADHYIGVATTKFSTFIEELIKEVY